MASDGPGSTPLLSSFPGPACYMARPGDFCQKTWIGTKARNGTESYHAHRSAAARGATGLAANVVSALCAKTDSPPPMHTCPLHPCDKWPQNRNSGDKSMRP